MNEANRNTKTLIMSFVIAVMVLVPLRFVEAGQELEMLGSNQVLGETSVVEEAVEEVGEAEEYVKEPVLEAPFDEIEEDQVMGVSSEGSSCIPVEEAQTVLDEIKTRIGAGYMDRVELDDALSQLTAIEENICK